MVVVVQIRTDEEVYWVMEGPRYIGEFDSLEGIENYFFSNHTVEVDLSAFK